MNQSELKADIRNRRQARENLCGDVKITFSSYVPLVAGEGDVRFSNQSQSVVEQNQSSYGFFLNWKSFY